MLSGYLWAIEDFRKADLQIERMSSDGEGKLSPEHVANIKRFKLKEHSSQLQLFGFWRSEVHKFMD
jgi:hypothetical protein